MHWQRNKRKSVTSVPKMDNLSWKLTYWNRMSRFLKAPRYKRSCRSFLSGKSRHMNNKHPMILRHIWPNCNVMLLTIDSMAKSWDAIAALPFLPSTLLTITWHQAVIPLLQELPLILKEEHRATNVLQPWFHSAWTKAFSRCCKWVLQWRLWCIQFLLWLIVYG